MSFGMIANGSQFARTSARAAESFPSEAKDERRLKGNYRAKGHQVFRVACGGVHTYMRRRSRWSNVDEDVEDGEEKGNGPDTLLIRDRRSPLHSRCTAGDSPRPSRASRAGFLSRPALHPAYAISHSVWWTTLSLLLPLLLLRGGEQK